MADVAAVGSVLIPAARRSRQNRAARWRCWRLPLSWRKPFRLHQSDHPGLRRQPVDRRIVRRGSAARGVDGAALIVLSIILGKRPEAATKAETRSAVSGLWSGAIASFGLIFMIFFGFKSGFATATEISAFAAVYALVVGSMVFRDLSFRTAAHSFVQSATRSGLVLFIVAAAQALAFVLTLQQVRMRSATSCCRCRGRTASGCSCCCRSSC